MYRADTFALMECLGPHCVDAIVTDPPYEISIADMEWDSTPLPIDWLAYNFARVVKPNGHVFVFCSDIQFGSWFSELSKYFYKLRKFAWCKTNSGQLKLTKLKAFAESFELAIHAWNPGAYFNQEKSFRNYLETPICSGNERVRSFGKVVHPTQKPVRVMEYVLEAITREGDMVLDPFAGLHTTARAATKLKRRFITNDQGLYHHLAKDVD